MPNLATWNPCPTRSYWTCRLFFPAGGGYTVHFPLLPDDPVLLLFSERDIAVPSSRRCAPVRRRPMMLWRYSTPSAYRGLCFPTKAML